MVLTSRQNREETMLRALLGAFAVLFLVQPVSADCKTELKPGDDYQKLSNILTCIYDAAKLKRDSETTVELLPDKPLETKDCIKSSSLPRRVTISMSDGVKFCRDDGSIWMKVTSAYNNQHYTVTWVQPDLPKPIVCGQTAPSCVLEDEESKQRFQVQIEIRRDEKRDKTLYLAHIRRR